MKPIPILCLLLSGSFYSYSQIQIDGSFLNITRPNGGPVATGDILQLRSVIAIPKNTNLANFYFTSAVPTGTSYVAGSLQVLTNEGLVVSGIGTTGSYTDGAGDDAAQITVANGSININMGVSAGIATGAGGSIAGGTTTPVFQSSATILMAAYQVRITAAAGSTITATGSFHYNNLTNPVPNTTLLVSTPYTCGSTGSNNFVSDETKGSFGNGNRQNRTTASGDVAGLTFTALSTTAPSDGAYSIVNSTAGDINNNKVWGVWDIIGDHSGSTTGTGNAPTPAGSTGGYLMAVNATYTPATIFTTTINGLTRNSTYTISFWAYNLCPSCANDPKTGLATTGPGVLPNISIAMNGSAVYSSGNVGYSGQWVKNSFTFNVGSATSATLAIKNNAPGGGGNDWAIDDISMTQCLVVLPLELSSFSARVVNGSVLLDWATASEDGVGGFAIQRSEDGVNFSTVGHVAGTGLTTGSDYTFTDSALGLAGQVWYRLYMTDGHGVGSYSSVVVVQLDGSSGGLTARLAPNPSSSGSAVNLLVNAPMAQPAHIGVYSFAGVRLFEQDASLVAGANTIALSSRSAMPPGVYIVKVVLNSGTICTKWIIFTP